jgi:hypothetical protein
LQVNLGSGWVERQELLKLAKGAGISFRKLERAKAGLGVVSEQRREQGRNVWYWGLPRLTSGSTVGPPQEPRKRACFWHNQLPSSTPFKP